MTGRQRGPHAAWLLAAAVAVPLGAAHRAETDLDAFMARVLERRNESWRQLHDYILSERERFDLIGPGDRRLFGGRREYTWFVRDGYLVRSPLRFDGVALDDKQRKDYEDKWLRDEQAREKKAAERKTAGKSVADGKTTENAASPHAASDSPQTGDVAGLPEDAAAIARRGMEPRFVSEAYFMRFKFEPGNYYLAGREALDGRPVLRIEYYPTRLFGDERPDGNRNRCDDQREAEMERKFNKVALITLWVDPEQHQIVKYTFDNVGLDFLPAQWLVRVDDVSASMVMGSYFENVWLPKTITLHAAASLASGAFDATYVREFFDYRLGEVKARVREYTPIK
jgi:hypothetical protein